MHSKTLFFTIFFALLCLFSLPTASAAAARGCSGGKHLVKGVCCKPDRTRTIGRISDSSIQARRAAMLFQPRANVCRASSEVLATADYPARIGCSAGSTVLSGVCCPPGSTSVDKSKRCCAAGHQYVSFAWAPSAVSNYVILRASSAIRGSCCPPGVTAANRKGRCQ